MPDNVIESFVMALGFKVDDATKNKIEGAARSLQKVVTDADKRITDAQVAGTAKRIVQANREAGVRTRGAASLIADHKQRQKAVVTYTEAEKAASQAREKVAKEEAAGGATQAAVFAARMASMAVAAAAFAAAVGYAVYKVTEAFTGLQRSSERTGASIQNIKGLAFAFSQVGGNSEQAVAALDNFKKALRTNPGIGAFVRSMGVSTEGDTFDVLSGALDKIQEKHPYYTGAQLAGLLGISEEQFDLFTRYKKEMKESKELHDRITKAFGVNSKEMGESSERLTRSMGVVGMVSRAAGEKIASVFLPVLDRMTLAIQGWIASHPEQMEAIFNGIRVASDSVSKALGWVLDKSGELFTFLSEQADALNKDGSFLRAWEKVAGVFDRTVAAIKTVITWLRELDRATDMSAGLDAIKKLFGWLEGKTSGTVQSGLHTIGAIDQGTDTGVGIPAQRASTEAREKPGLLRRGWEAAKRAVGLGSTSDSTTGSTAPIGGRTFREKAPGVMKRLKEDFGLSTEEAAVVLGNLGHESAGFTAFKEGGNGPGRGWAQWTDPGRKRRFFDYAKERRLDPESDEANYGFLKWELQNTHKSSIAKLKKAEGRDEKMRVFEQDFEGAGVKAYGSRNRYMREAERAYEEAERNPARQPAPANQNQPSPTGSAPKAPTFNFPKINMSPGGFDVNKALQAPAPMGASSTDNSSSRTLSQTINNNVKIEGSGDPANDARHTERALGRSSELSLRNAQTAIR